MTNPPSSRLRHFLSHSPRVSRNVVFLMPLNHLTTRRAEGHHHSIAGVSARMTPAEQARDLLPYYLASGARLVRPAEAGLPLVTSDCAFPKSELLALFTNVH